jgi:osmotically-inducible protein OsmY
VLDNSLEQAVMEALAHNPRVQADEVVVDGRDGDVVLRGTVGSVMQRAEAARTARGVPGVRRVDDRLRIRPLGIDGRVDADTEAAVLAALIADDEVPASQIDVKVREGKVTLRGIVELSAQRDRAERIVMGVGGVSQVRNELKVWLLVSADDVADRVTDALGAGAVVGIEQVTVDGEEPEIFRRSVPYGTSQECGLYFVAFSAKRSRYDRMLARMLGTAPDGLHDHLTDFSRPVSGAYYFAPSLNALRELAGA